MPVSPGLLNPLLSVRSPRLCPRATLPFCHLVVVKGHDTSLPDHLRLGGEAGAQGVLRAGGSRCVLTVGPRHLFKPLIEHIQGPFSLIPRFLMQSPPRSQVPASAYRQAPAPMKEDIACPQHSSLKQGADRERAPEQLAH